MEGTYKEVEGTSEVRKIRYNNSKAKGTTTQTSSFFFSILWVNNKNNMYDEDSVFPLSQSKRRDLFRLQR